ncbi:MAG: hypothetical protein ACRD0P_39920, partial [Stackebrandtia sp.]
MNRELSADDELGADQVYQLAGGDPDTVMAAVERIDPDGDSLMGVMRMVDRYNGKPFTVVAAQADRLAQVGRLRDRSAEQLSQLAEELHPEEPDPLRITDFLKLDITVDTVESDNPMNLGARIAVDGENPKTVLIDELTTGDHEYDIDLPECAKGCRLIGIGAVRYPGDYDTVDVSLRVNALRDATGALDAGLTDPDAWRPSWQLSPNVDLAATPGPDGLSLAVTTDEADDLLAEYVAAPPALPAMVAGAIPNADADHGQFDFLGPHNELQTYQQISTSTVIPRGGSAGILVDLDYTNRYAQSITALGMQDDLNYEIWASDSAPPDLAQRLAES